MGDQESDFRRRVRDMSGTLRMGTLGAWSTGTVSINSTGVYIPIEELEQIIKFIPPEKFDPKLILTIENAHLKRLLIKHVGWEFILQKVGGKSIHKDGDYELYEIENLGARTVNVKLLKVKCPSSGAYYVLRVPPETKTCKEAKDWTFANKDEGEIEFIEEA